MTHPASESIVRGVAVAPRRAWLVLAPVALVGLTACGDSDAPTTAPTGSTTSAPGESGHGNSEHDAPSPVPDDVCHVPVTARSIAFEPNEVTVEVGEPVAIVLSSENALHDFVVDEVDAHVSAEAGETVVGGFRATEPGRYSYYCTVAGHRDAGMEGILVVEAAS